MFRAIRNILARENSVRSASIILIVTLAMSNILGVIRDHFLARKIPTDRLDIYFAAFRLPDLVFNVLILGSIAAAFIPIYSRYLKERGQGEATRLAQNSLSVALLAVGASLVILFFLMPVLMKGLVFNFELAKRQETVELARWLLLSPLLFTVSYFLGGILNSHKRFVVYSLAPLIYNLSIIAAVLLFADKIGVKGVAIGVISGAFLHMAIQLVAAKRLGFYFKFIPDLKNSGVRRIIRLMVPRAIGLGANQILLVAYTALASAFPGAIAIYNFADNIQTVPSVIFGTSFATAVFPTLAGLSAHKAGELEEFRRFFIKGIRAILFFMLPASALLILLRAQVVRLILGYGFFGWSDTSAAAGALGFFALSIVAQGLIPLFARGFYALQDTKTPMFSSIVSIAVSIALGFIFSRTPGVTEGVAGLALAFSIGCWLNAIILIILMTKRIGLVVAPHLVYLAQIIVLTVVLAVVTQATKMLVASGFDINRVKFLALQTLCALAAGGVAYLGGAWLLRIKEVRS